MDRLQKKCFIVSIGSHLLLGVILVVGPAFLSASQKPSDLATLDAIPSKVIDEAFRGGGHSSAAPPPATLAPPAPAPPAPAPPAPKAREPEPTPLPEKPAATESLEPAPDAHKKPKLDINLTPVNHRTAKSSSAKKPSDSQDQAREAADERRREAVAAIGRAARGLNNDISATTSIDVDPGTGGEESYANYGQVVISIYKSAWITPEDASSENPITLVSVTIASDGSVLESRIIQSSGDASVDRSVQRTLDRVTFIHAFPEGAKEKQRTYKIKFDLKAKRLLE